MHFASLAPSNLKIKKKVRVGYVYIEESFDTIFNMGYCTGLLLGKIAHGLQANYLLDIQYIMLNIFFLSIPALIKDEFG